jgi:hypothetical protein
MLIDCAQRRVVLLLSGLAATLVVVSACAALWNVQLYQPVMAEPLVIGSLGFDLVSLVSALLLLGCIWAIGQGLERYRLFWPGLVGHLFYAYALYAFGLVYTDMYLLYLAVVGLAAYSLIFFAVGINRQLLVRWTPVRLPRRGQQTSNGDVCATRPKRKFR